MTGAAVRIKETHLINGMVVIEIVNAFTGEILASDAFIGKYNTDDLRRGWWMATADENDWTVLP